MTKNFDEPPDDKFGVTLILQNCAFSAEIQRDRIVDVIQTIDKQLDEQGAPDDDVQRAVMMVGTASRLSGMIANKEIDADEGAADIAYGFVYALGKKVGLDQMLHLRGLTGGFSDDQLLINPCLGEQEFRRESAILMQNQSDEGDSETIQSQPTVH